VRDWGVSPWNQEDEVSQFKSHMTRAHTLVNIELVIAQ
jgi:hypothetical protein